MSTRWPSDVERVGLPLPTRECVRALLDVGRYRTLLMLGAHGPAKPHMLARYTRLSRKETVSHLTALRDLGLIEREVGDGQDRWALWQVIRGALDVSELARSEDPDDQETYVEWLGVAARHQMIALSDWRREWDSYAPDIRQKAASAERVLGVDV